jgi:hypothetical protein
VRTHVSDPKLKIENKAQIFIKAGMHSTPLFMVLVVVVVAVVVVLVVLVEGVVVVVVVV